METGAAGKGKSSSQSLCIGLAGALYSLLILLEVCQRIDD